MFALLNTLGDRLGNWNPQLLRELKSRLTLRSVAIAVGISVIFQSILWMSFSGEICLESVGSECSIYRWETNWPTIFHVLSWTLSSLAFAGGAHLLGRDMIAEESRGTANFIRLSPQKSQHILLGKLLGIPMLIYIALDTLLPMHWIAGIRSDVPANWLVSFYLFVGTLAAFLYVVMLISACLNKGSHPPLVGELMAWVFGSLCVGQFYTRFDWYEMEYQPFDIDLRWFVWDIDSQPAALLLLTLVTIVVATYWVWQMLNRKFVNPGATFLSKQQSYWLMGGFHVCLVGLCWQPFQLNLRLAVGILVFASLLSFGLLAEVISPQRQAILDWARYTDTHTEGRRSSWKNWLFGDRSPSIVALGVNLAIASGIWLVAIALAPHPIAGKIDAILMLLLSVNLVFLYIIVVQFVYLTKLNRNLAASLPYLASAFPWLIYVAIGKEAVLPLLGMALLFSYPFTVLEEVAVVTACFACLMQWTAIAGLGFVLRSRLKSLGESQTKALMKG